MVMTIQWVMQQMFEQRSYKNSSFNKIRHLYIVPGVFRLNNRQVLNNQFNMLDVQNKCTTES